MLGLAFEVARSKLLGNIGLVPLEPIHAGRRALQDLTSLITLASDPSALLTPSTLVKTLRTVLCTDRAVLSGIVSTLDADMQKSMPGAQPLEPVVMESGWSCICTDFQIGSEYDEAITTLMGGDVDETEVTKALLSLIPIVMGNGGLCSTGCRGFAKALGNWAIASISWSSLSSDLASLPPLDTLSGLPNGGVDCLCEYVPLLPPMLEGGRTRTTRPTRTITLALIPDPSTPHPDPIPIPTPTRCSSVSWTDFAGLWTNDMATAVNGGAQAYTTGILTLTSSMESALSDTARYPTFLLGPKGFCAAGCDSSFKMVASLAVELIAALMPQIDASLAVASAPVAAISIDRLHSCMCDGALDWHGRYQAR